MKMQLAPTKLFPLALLLGAAAAMLVACGDRNGLIAPGDADQLGQHLDAVRNAVADGDCQVTEVNLTRVRSDLQNLRSGGMDDRLYRNLRSGVSTLSARAAEECQTAATVPTTTTPTQTETETQPTTPTTTTPTTTTPTETTTTPTTTTPTTPTPTTPTTPSTNPGGAGAGTGGAGDGQGAGE